MYRLDSRSQKLTYLPLTTFDSDIAVPTKVALRGAASEIACWPQDFKKNSSGEDRPPATHYHLHGHEGFYVEFLTPLVGSEHTRAGKRKATQEVGGISSQQLRYVDILLVKPWRIALNQANGFPFKSPTEVQVANPASFIAQKILIQRERNHKDRAKDVLYIHDTIEALSENLSGLREIFEKDIRQHLHARRVRELTGAAEALFGSVNDTVRESARMASGRKLSGAALAETCRAGLREIFEQASASTPSKLRGP